MQKCIRCGNPRARNQNVCKRCRNYYTKSWYHRNKEKARYLARTKWRKLRQEIITSYGGKCVCCGETTYEFLGIDHIYNDGAEQRRKSGINGGGSNFYWWLKKQGLPKDRFQLLCHNCNFAKGHYGKCPHETLRSLADEQPPQQALGPRDGP